MTYSDHINYEVSYRFRNKRRSVKIRNFVRKPRAFTAHAEGVPFEIL